MNVKLLAHTQLSEEFQNELFDIDDTAELLFEKKYSSAVIKSHGQPVALTAIRTCYSPGKPSEIVLKEGAKYFGNGGTEADRLFRMIVRSGHTSTLEHLSFTFAIEGVSRALLAQLQTPRRFQLQRSESALCQVRLRRSVRRI
jgi:thymidylate synthase (FAD)